MKEIEDDRDIEIYQNLRLQESVLSKWQYYTRKSVDSTQSLSNYQWCFTQK